MRIWGQILRNIIPSRDARILGRNLGAEPLPGLCQPEKGERGVVDEQERHLRKFLEDPIGIGVRTTNMGDNAPMCKVVGEDGKEI